MTERTDDWRSIFSSLVEDDGIYEIDKVNIYHLASHLEELYVSISDSNSKVEQIQQNQSNLAIAVANLLNRIETLEQRLDKQE
jgi:flagellar capping protein FliD